MIVTQTNTLSFHLFLYEGEIEYFGKSKKVENVSKFWNFSRGISHESNLDFFKVLIVIGAELTFILKVDTVISTWLFNRYSATFRQVIIEMQHIGLQFTWPFSHDISLQIFCLHKNSQPSLGLNKGNGTNVTKLWRKQMKKGGLKIFSIFSEEMVRQNWPFFRQEGFRPCRSLHLVSVQYCSEIFT